MAELKKPQDHLSAQSLTATVHGINLTIDKSVMDDWDVVELIAEVQDDSVSQARQLAITVKLLKLILGDKYETVKSTLRADNDGQLGIEVMSGFLTELFGVLNPNS